MANSLLSTTRWVPRERNFSLLNFLGKQSKISEPNFEEVIVLFRGKAESSSDDLDSKNKKVNPASIHVQRFYGVPFEGITAVLPAGRRK